MFGLGFQELLIIFVIFFLLFGALGCPSSAARWGAPSGSSVKP